ncbi:MAG: Gfo/Idh/MocA family oxidoreductase [Planctomycetes bacterium]|nr:Gfo/Idh/MocA family oxidoreductase [Planctomycetota bacterium]
MKKWKVGVVFDTKQKSKGDHGTHLSFTGLPDVEQVLVDQNCDNLAPRMEQIGASRHYTDYREMLESEQPDIVSVCSRLPGDHYEIIKAAAESNCHILCEKPLVASLQEADEIEQLAAKHNIRIAVAHLARHALVFRTVKAMIEGGDIGAPLTVYGRGKEDERGGGEDMMVLGTHILDLFTFLFGTPEYVFSDVRFEDRPITVKDRTPTTEPIGLCAGDSVWASFKFNGGVNGLFESRRGLYKNKVRMGITVVGTEGAISVRYDQDRNLRLTRSALPPEDESQYEAVDLVEDRTLPAGTQPLDYENYGPQPAHYFADGNRFAAINLMQAIEENRQPVCSVHDATIALEMIYGVYASSLERKAVSFPLATRSHPLGE